MNFAFNQPNQQPQQFQINQMNQTQFNPVINMQQQYEQLNRQHHLNSVRQPLSKLFQLQNQPELHYLIQWMKTQQNLANEQIKKTVQQTDIKAIQPQQMDQMFKRGQKIREKNALLLNRLLLVKAKLQRLMYQNMNPHSRYQYETSVTMDKIRNLKSEITQKCAYLKTLKVNKSMQNGDRRNQSKSSNFSNIGTALTELKNGAEVLEREVLRQKTEMEFVVNYLNDKY